MLTAKHVVAGGIREVVVGPAEVRPTIVRGSTIEVLNELDGDLALLFITSDLPPVNPVPLASIDRNGTEVEAFAIGYPAWKLRKQDARTEDDPVLREVAQVWGTIPPISNMRAGTYEFLTQGPAQAQRLPRPDGSSKIDEPPSPWEGISGAPVFAANSLIGIVSKHYANEGTDRLSVTPIDALAHAASKIPRIAGATGSVQELRPVNLRGSTLGTGLQTGPAQGLSTAVAQTRRLEPSVPLVGRAEVIREAVMDHAASIGPTLRHYTVGGMPGLGKTALACAIAEELEPDYPDGFRIIDMRGHAGGHDPVDTGDAALALLMAGTLSPELAHRANTVSDSTENRVALWQEWLGQHSAFVVIDNARSAAQVDPLLPRSATSCAVVTSRTHLGLLSGTPIRLVVLNPDEARALIERLSKRKVEAVDSEAMEFLVDLCGGLPLAIQIVAAKIRNHPSRTLSDHVRLLRSHGSKLDALAHPAFPIAVAFHAVYEELDPLQRRTFRTLASMPVRSFDRFLTASVMDVPVDVAARVLDELADASLLEEIDSLRFSFHDLLREFGVGLPWKKRDGSPRAARARGYQHFLQAASQATGLIGARTPILSRSDAGTPAQTGGAQALDSNQDALDWFEAEIPNLLEMAAAASADSHPLYLVDLMASTAEYTRRRGPWITTLDLHRRAAEAAEAAGAHVMRAQALIYVGMLEQRLGRHHEALDSFDVAVDVSRMEQQLELEALALNHRGTVLRRLRGRIPDAYESTEQALAIYQQLGLVHEIVNALCYLTIISLLTNNFPAALATAAEAHRLADDSRYGFGRAYAAALLGRTAFQQGDLGWGEQLLRDALSDYRLLHHNHGVAETAQQLAILRSLRGDHPGAEEDLRAALREQVELGNVHGMASANCELARVMMRRGHASEALPAARESLRLNLLLDIPLGIAEARNVFGIALLLGPRAGAAAAAKREFHKALREARRASSRLERARAHLGLGLDPTATVHRRRTHLVGACALYKAIGSGELTDAYDALGQVD